MSRRLNKGYLNRDQINMIKKGIKQFLNQIQILYIQQNLRRNVKHHATCYLWDILHPECKQLQKIPQRRILPQDLVVPRLTGHFHELQSKDFSHITLYQQKIIEDILQRILIRSDKVVTYQDVANFAKKVTKNKDFLPSIRWSRKFLNQRPRLKRKIFQVKQEFLQFKKEWPMIRGRIFSTAEPIPYKKNHNKKSNDEIIQIQNQQPLQEAKQQEKVQDETITLPEDQIKKFSQVVQQIMRVTQIQTKAPEQTRQKKKYTIERKQLAVEEVVANSMQDDQQILQPIVQPIQESNHSPLICHQSKHDYNIDSALAQQQREINDLPSPSGPRKF